jgi:hypothetical protein
MTMLSPTCVVRQPGHAQDLGFPGTSIYGVIPFKYVVLVQIFHTFVWIKLLVSEVVIFLSCSQSSICGM